MKINPTQELREAQANANIENFARMFCACVCSCATCRNKDDCNFKALLTVFYNNAKAHGAIEQCAVHTGDSCETCTNHKHAIEEGVRKTFTRIHEEIRKNFQKGLTLTREELVDFILYVDYQMFKEVEADATV